MRGAAEILTLCTLLLATTSFAQNYKAEKTSDHGVPIVRLSDAANGVEISVLPSVGNLLYSMKVHGKNILYFPFDDLSEFVKKPKTERDSISRAVGRPVGRTGLLGQRKTVWIQYESGQRPRRHAGSRVHHEFATLGGNGGGGR